MEYNEDESGGRAHRVYTLTVTVNASGASLTLAEAEVIEHQWIHRPLRTRTLATSGVPCAHELAQVILDLTLDGRQGCLW